MKELSNTSEKDSLLIERFLDYELNDQETDLFFARMEQDAAFKKQVTLAQKAHEELLSLMHTRTYHQREIVSKVDEVVVKKSNEKAPAEIVKMPIEKKKPKRVKMFWLSAAAAACLILFFIPWSDIIPSEPIVTTSYAIALANEKVSAFNTDQIALTLRRSRQISAPVDTQKLKLEIVTLFKQKEYQKILEKSDSLEQNSGVYLLRAIAFKEVGNFEKAEEAYLDALKSKGGQEGIIRWGLVELYLQQEQHMDQVIEQLELLSSDTNFNRTKDAKTLLKHFKTD